MATRYHARADCFRRWEIAASGFHQRRPFSDGSPPDRSLSGVNSGESFRFFSGFAFGVCTVHSEYFSGLIIARNKLTSSFVIGK
jgi:hypothetical protein